MVVLTANAWLIFRVSCFKVRLFSLLWGLMYLLILKNCTGLATGVASPGGEVPGPDGGKDRSREEEVYPRSIMVLISTGLVRVSVKGAPSDGIISILNGMFTPRLVVNWFFTMEIALRSA